MIKTTCANTRNYTTYNTGKHAYEVGEWFDAQIKVSSVKEGTGKSGKKWTLAKFKLSCGSDACAFIPGAVKGDVFFGKCVVNSKEYNRYNLGGKFQKVD